MIEFHQVNNNRGDANNAIPGEPVVLEGGPHDGTELVVLPVVNRLNMPPASNERRCGGTFEEFVTPVVLGDVLVYDDARRRDASGRRIFACLEPAKSPA